MLRLHTLMGFVPAPKNAPLYSPFFGKVVELLTTILTLAANFDSLLRSNELGILTKHCGYATMYRIVKYQPQEATNDAIDKAYVPD